MANRNRIVTPYTDPSRFTREEKAAFDAGECCWDVGDSHKLLEDHWPDGSPRR